MASQFNCDSNTNCAKIIETAAKALFGDADLTTCTTHLQDLTFNDLQQLATYKTQLDDSLELGGKIDFTYNPSGPVTGSSAMDKDGVIGNILTKFIQKLINLKLY